MGRWMSGWVSGRVQDHAPTSPSFEALRTRKRETEGPGGGPQLLRTETGSDSVGHRCDGPSGLDAVMGELVCALLRDLACTNPNSGRIVMAALHTPSSKVFQVCNDHSLTYWQPAGRLSGYGVSVRQYKATWLCRLTPSSGAAVLPAMCLLRGLLCVSAAASSRRCSRTCSS